MLDTAVVDWVITIARPNASRGVVTDIHTKAYVSRFHTAAAPSVPTSSQVRPRTCAHTSLN